MRSGVLFRILGILAIYLGIRYFGGPIGLKILYPITMLVTFLHEFGHALGAIITGGTVEAIRINENGSGFTITSGGSQAIVLMGGYLGSAILGNLLFYIGARKEKFSNIALYLLAAIMVYTSLFWYSSIFTTIILLSFALFLFIIAKKTNFGREVLMFFGLASIIYIIQDFNIGPRSDLDHYADIFIFIPAFVWMYLWLGVALLLTFYNLKVIFKQEKKY